MNCIRLVRTTIRPQIVNIISQRFITHHPLKFDEKQDRYRRLDDVSRKWQLIYKAPMEKALNYATTFLTFSSAAVTGGALYYIATFDPVAWKEPVFLGTDVIIANDGPEFMIYVGAYIIFHLALKVLLNKYVVRLYQDGDKYLAIFRGHTFNSIKKHEFQLNEFKKLKPTLVVTWGDARFGLGKKHGIILEDYFKSPEYFNYLLTKKKVQSVDD